MSQHLVKYRIRSEEERVRQADSAHQRSSPIACLQRRKRKQHPSCLASARQSEEVRDLLVGEVPAAGTY